MSAKKEPVKLEHNIEELPTKDECFIITPIGEIGSPDNVKAMGLIEAVMSPVLDGLGFTAIAAHQIKNSGSINNQIIKHILEDKLVIANLTGLNPNVMYELAVRHAVRKPVIIMAEKGTRLPFDMYDQRTIFYYDSLAGTESAKSDLRSMVDAALKEEKPDNPIYQVAEQELIFKDLEESNPLKLIMERLDRMETSAQRLAKPTLNQGAEQTIEEAFREVNRKLKGYIVGTIDEERLSTGGAQSVHEVLKPLLHEFRFSVVSSVSLGTDGLWNFQIQVNNPSRILVDKIVKYLKSHPAVTVNHYSAMA